MIYSATDRLKDVDWKAAGIATLGVATGFVFYFLYRQGQVLTNHKTHIESLKDKVNALEQENGILKRILQETNAKVSNLEQQAVTEVRALRNVQQGFNDRQLVLERSQGLFLEEQRRQARQISGLRQDLVETAASQEEIRESLQRQTATTTAIMRAANHIISGASGISTGFNSTNHEEVASSASPLPINSSGGSVLFKMVFDRDLSSFRVLSPRVTSGVLSSNFSNNPQRPLVSLSDSINRSESLQGVSPGSASTLDSGTALAGAAIFRRFLLRRPVF